MRINNNIMALNTHRQYGINNANISKSTEKLSSGYRINRAGDDAAGLAISEKMRAQIRGLTMASKNSQDAISLVQTAEGALQETHNILQRMRELATQASSDTNETSIDRNALNLEFQELIKEIDDTASKTKFNDMGLIDGTFQSKIYSATTTATGATVSADAVESEGTRTISVNKVDYAAATVDNAATTVTSTADAKQIAASPTFAFDAAFGAGANGATVEFSISQEGDNATVTATVTGGTKPGIFTAEITNVFDSANFGAAGEEMSIKFDGLGTLTVTSGSETLVKSGAVAGDSYDFGTLATEFEKISVTGGAGTDEVKARNYLAIGTEQVDLVAGQTSASFSNGIVLEFGAITTDANGAATNLDSLFGTGATSFNVVVTSKAGKDFVVQTGANQGDELSINIDNMNAKTLGVKHSKVSDRTSASNAITETNKAINKVSTQRAALGALQNRLNHKISNLDTSAENLTAAESRIRDVDMAKEMTTFTRNNILFQAATAMLAQANSAPQGVLQLLG